MERQHFSTQKEMEIHMGDMLLFILLKWRCALGAALILAIIMGGYSYYKGVSNIKNGSGQESLSSLDDEQKNKVDNTLFLLENYQELYDTQKEYNANSILMKLDANAVHTVELSYYIDNHFAVTYPDIGRVNNINAIMLAYQSIIMSQEFFDEVGEYNREKINVKYIEELIDIHADTDEAGIVNITAYGNSKEFVEFLTECIMDAVSESKEQITQALGEHDVMLIKSTYATKASSKIFDIQKKNIENLFTFGNYISSIKDSISEDEQLYIDTLQGVDIEQNKPYSEIENSTNGLPTIDFRYVLLGGIIGICLVACFAIIQYMLDDKVKNEEELESGYELDILGIVKLPKEGRRKVFQFVDEWIIKIKERNKRYISNDEGFKMAATKILTVANQKKLRKVIFIGSYITDTEKSVINKISEMIFDRTDIEILVGSDVTYDAEAYTKLVSADGVVLLESKGTSTYNNIGKELDICNIQEKVVLGAIFVM